jgi:hypothetical protein
MANNKGLNFVDPKPGYTGIVAAGGSHARTIKSPEVEAALAEGMRAVHEETRCAVIDARISAGNRAYKNISWLISSPLALQWLM